MKNTLRLLLTWDCNLDCDYCCNKLPSVQESISPITQAGVLDCLDAYDVVCLSGGEPFLNTEILFNQLKYMDDKEVYIYSNGLKIKDSDIDILKECYPQVKGVNIGLHYSQTFVKLIRRFEDDKFFRFHIEDIHKDMVESIFSDVDFHYWHRDDCDMDNEDIRILTLNI